MLQSEEFVESPKVTLNLYDEDEGKEYFFRVGDKEDLSAEITLFACLEFAAIKRAEESIFMAELAYSDGSPGLAFKLGEHHLAELVAQVNHPDIQVEYNSENQLQLSFSEPSNLGLEVLQSYYIRSTRDRENP